MILIGPQTARVPDKENRHKLDGRWFIVHNVGPFTNLVLGGQRPDLSPSYVTGWLISNLARPSVRAVARRENQLIVSIPMINN